jgi:hypothetical protein
MLGGSGRSTTSAGLAAPVFVPARRAVEDAVSGGRALPAHAVTPVTRAIGGLLEDRELIVDLTEQPARITPGSLGHWSDTEADAV